MYDNSTHEPRLIASGSGTETLGANQADLWQRIRVEAGLAGKAQNPNRPDLCGRSEG